MTSWSRHVEKRLPTHPRPGFSPARSRADQGTIPARWQDFRPATEAMPPLYEARYPARLPDGRVLFLPIRPLDQTGLGIASLILNQCSFEFESTLADFLSDRLKPAEPDVIVGMPTLGLSLARAVAKHVKVRCILHTKFRPIGG